MRKKTLLIDEYPLLVLPSLATSIGLNEAIALQQLHYWLENPKGGVMLDGERWVYNTYEDWQKDNFPFWSVRTVVRVFDHLEEMKLVVSMQQASYDRKKYYRIHYDNLAQWNMPDCQDASCQDGTFDHDKVASSLTETTSETTTEKTEEEARNPLFSLYENNLGMLTPRIADWLVEAEKTYSFEWVSEAIQIAAKNGAKSWNYCETILKRWKQEGKSERPGKKKSAAASGDRNRYVTGEYSHLIEH
jgi:DnaD/phage-associated family protein